MRTAVLTILLFPSLALADPEARARAALALAASSRPVQAAPAIPDAQDAYRRALAEKVPFIVHVGRKPLASQQATGLASCFMAEYWGSEAPRIVVSGWEDGKLVWKGDLHFLATAEEIEQLAARPARREPAQPQVVPSQPFYHAPAPPVSFGGGGGRSC